MARYVWYCGWHNNASRPSIDGERCLAKSRKTFPTEEAATAAADRHRARADHRCWWPSFQGPEIVKLGRRRKW